MGSINNEKISKKSCDTATLSILICILYIYILHKYLQAFDCKTLNEVLSCQGLSVPSLKLCFKFSLLASKVLLDPITSEIGFNVFFIMII